MKNDLIKKDFGRVYARHVIMWLLLRNYLNGNEYQQAGFFGDKEVHMGALGWQFVSYKGSTRISDTVYDELPASVIERKTFKTRSGVDHYKYRLVKDFSPADVGRRYAGIIAIFKMSPEYPKNK